MAGANVHETKLLELTLESVVVERPDGGDRRPQHLCLDKGYDNPTGHRAVAAHGYRGHIRRIGEEKLDAKGENAIRHAAGWWSVPYLGSPNAGGSWSGMTRKRPTTWAWCNWRVPYPGTAVDGNSSFEIVTKINEDGASAADYSGVPDDATFNGGETEKSFTFSAAQNSVQDIR